MPRTSSAIAANRFGLGARPGEMEHIGGEHQDWLLEQIERPGELSDPIRELPTSKAILSEFQAERAQRGKLRKQRRAGEIDAEQVRKLIGSIRKVLLPHYKDQAAARGLQAATTDQPFRERLVHFWNNHFAVSADKPPVLGLAGAFENEAIRPHVDGYFIDMLMTVEKHPAMILYLDNQASIGPNSTMGRFAARRKSDREFGINENLGREILELHTLGVDGGYGQTDVTSFAKVITGWSIGGGQGRLREAPPGEFHFRKRIHEPGSQKVMGSVYGQKGVAQGEAVLRDLAAHPSTADFLATKLARHFIADDPPASAVGKIARAYRQSDGYLPDVYRAMIESGEAWDEPLRKFKTPQDFVVSTFRALDVTPERPEAMLGPLDMLGQAPYMPGSPAGWPDRAASWDGADALLRRIEFSVTVGERAAAGHRPDDLAGWALGPVLGNHTQTAIARAETAAQGIALVLASPEFQRR